MRVYLTKHARRRMERRAITLNQIQSALRFPDITMPALPGPRRRVMKRFGNKSLDVIYVREEDRHVIITAAWLKEEDRFRAH